ncbi:hypothetical protein HHS34_005750 [Acidithiobacillus montserratensis]|uniref:Uncharacterized protein n=1 Tax=Acidithiobacillus montserratensis TaxID=2729135 RepID=A0ACD5HJ57_9PROT|nr:hypothetical protein [Acidithiobacillus montserratensis]MBU2748631.1 hypothetical protein [Acidithiobacillus montserratensis]
MRKTTEKDLARRAAHESAIRIHQERRRQTKALIKRDGYETIDQFIAAAQARMVARGTHK